MIELNQFLHEFKLYRSDIFKSHASYVLKNFLEPWAKHNLIDKSYHIDINDNDLLGLIVEDRPTDLFRFAILNTLLMTRLRMPIIIYTSEESYASVKSLFSDILLSSNIIKIQFFEYTSMNIDNYNRLLTSSDFWRNLSSEKIFIFQTDSLLIESMDFSMFNFDYIGAPFCKGKSRSIRFPLFLEDLSDEIGSTWATQSYNEEQIMGIMIGNGGLSIRSRSIMEKICLNENPQQNEKEDIFFSRLIKKYSNNLPPISIAKRFSIEADYFPSIGFHASYFYLSPAELAEIYDRHIRNIIGLISSHNNPTLLSRI